MACLQDAGGTCAYHAQGVVQATLHFSHLARSRAVVGVAAALDADDGVDDLPAAVDLLAFVVGDARQRHLVQHRADARTFRFTMAKWKRVKKLLIVQGSANPRAPGCENALGKFMQKC